MSIINITNLLKDVQAGRLNTLEDFFKNHPHVCWTQLQYEKTSDTILHVACRLGYVEIVKYLLDLDNAKHVDYKNRDGKTPLHEAAQFSQHEVVIMLIRHGADVNALKRADWTPLMLACTKCTARSFDCVDALLRNGAHINYQNKDGWTPLHLICREGNSHILNLLISHGLDIGKLTKNGRSALHVASLHGHLHIVKMLTPLGLNPNIKDSCGNTPVHEAVLGGHIDVCNYFVSVGGDFLVNNNANLGVLHLAASLGHLAIIKFLVKTIGIDVNIKNKNSLTPLHCSARKRHRDTVDLLIELGANIEHKDNFGRSIDEYFRIGNT